MTDINILLFGAAGAGFLHALAPDHYLPFIVLSKARKWSIGRTLFTTFYCGLGHVASSIIIASIGVALGYGVSHIEVAGLEEWSGGVDAVRGKYSKWLFLAFGFVYLVWGIYSAIKNKPHTHFHSHGDGEAHVHADGHTPHTDHTRQSTQRLTRWVLFIIFVLGPCEALLPFVIIPASQYGFDFTGIMLVALLFSTITILTMCATVTIGYYGFKILPTAKIERFMHAIAGAVIFLSGFVILFLAM
jgi:hypothetical protein